MTVYPHNPSAVGQPQDGERRIKLTVGNDSLEGSTYLGDHGESYEIGHKAGYENNEFLPTAK